MLYEIKLRITKAILGDSITRGIRKFKRNHNQQRIIWPAGRWDWAIKNATHSLKLNCDPGAVCLGEDFFAPTTQRCFREWRDGSGLHKEQFESIPAGAVISIYPEIPLESFPEGAAVPTLCELERIVEYVGAITGMSHWGSNWGYGRFTIESIGEALTKDHFLSVKNSKLPTKFLSDYIPKAREVKFLGLPICSLNRNELLAVAAHYIVLQEKNDIR